MEETNKIPLTLTFVKRKVSPTVVQDPPSTTQEVPTPSTTTTSSQVDRDRIKKKFVATLKNTSMGGNIEKCLYKRIVEETGRDFPNDIFRQEYLGAAHNLLENLDPEGSVGNTYLHPLVISGQIKPDALVRLSDHDLYPPKWQEIKDRRLKEIKTENEMKQATSDLYKCGKCGKRETTFYQLQTRSMDEPTTSFINCTNCGHRWKD